MNILISIAVLTIGMLVVVPEVFFSLGEFKDFFSAIESIFVALASIYAILAFDKWKNEIIYRRQVELAEDTVEAFDRLPQDIRYVLCGLMTTGEINQAKVSLQKEFEEELATKDPDVRQKIKLLTDSQVYWNRLQDIKDSLGKVEALKSRFVFYFEENSQTYFEEVVDVYKEIENRVRADYMAINYDDVQANDYRERIKQNAQWEQRVVAACSAIREICRPVIKRVV